MTPPDDAGLLALLRKVESGVQCGPGSPDFGGTTNWYRNPEGPQAADRIEALKGEVERFASAAHEMCRRIDAIGDSKERYQAVEAVLPIINVLIDYEAARSLSRPVEEES